jgi:hypothetical protein
MSCCHFAHTPKAQGLPVLAVPGEVTQWCVAPHTPTFAINVARVAAALLFRHLERGLPAIGAAKQAAHLSIRNARVGLASFPVAPYAPVCLR